MGGRALLDGVVHMCAFVPVRWMSVGARALGGKGVANVAAAGRRVGVQRNALRCWIFRPCG